MEDVTKYRIRRNSGSCFCIVDRSADRDGEHQWGQSLDEVISILMRDAGQTSDEFRTALTGYLRTRFHFADRISAPVTVSIPTTSDCSHASFDAFLVLAKLALAIGKQDKYLNSLVLPWAMGAPLERLLSEFVNDSAA